MDLISWKRLNSCSSFLFYFPMFVFSDIKGSLLKSARLSTNNFEVWQHFVKLNVLQNLKTLTFDKLS